MTPEDQFRELQQQWTELHKSLMIAEQGTMKYPIGSNAAEAMDLLKTYYGPLSFIAHKMAFLSQFRGFTALAITSELSKINEFIKTCNENEILWYEEALEWAKGTINQVYFGYQPDMFRYILLKDGGYDNLEPIVNEAGDFRMKGTVDYITKPDDDLVTVYARYFLFKDFLENELKQITTASRQVIKPISQDAIALLHQYLFLAGEGDAITSDNKEEIAKKYGWTAEGSGKKILAAFSKYHDVNNRKKAPTNQTQSINIHDQKLQSVIRMLSDHPNAKAWAENEYQLFKKNPN